MSITEINSNIPLFPNDTIIFGILCIILAAIFYSSNLSFFTKFYKVVPTLLLCYFLPSVFTSLGLIADKWIDVNAAINHLQGIYGNLTDVNTLDELKNYIVTNNIQDSEYAQFIDGSKLYYISSRFLLPHH